MATIEGRDYVLGHEPSELARLVQQARFYGDLTEDLLRSAGVGPGMRVLDVGAGTGNASIPAAQTGAEVVASDLTPELLEAGRGQVSDNSLKIDWVEADAENLQFEDESFDVVMSCIGAMFAPHHQKVADELVRVTRPGGKIAMLNWTPEGMIGGLFRTMGPFAPPPPPGATPPPKWGGEDHVKQLFGDRVELHTLQRGVLEVTAFGRPRDLADHFRECYGPTSAARKNASKDGREGDLDAALDGYFEEANLGTPDSARFAPEYLIAVGTRR